MGDYISRAEVLKKFLERGGGYINELTMKNMINEIPVADVKPVKHTINESAQSPCKVFICQNCGIRLEDWVEVSVDDDYDEWRTDYEFKFCPNCSAKIEVVESE